MITLQELCEHLDGYLQIANFKDCCPNGIQVEGSANIGKIATAVSASINVIQMAVEEGVGALIVHHGMFWNRDEFPIVGAKKEKLRLLIENGISLIAYHLPLDAHQSLGNNWKVALDLKWLELKPFGIFEGNAIGVKGRFPKVPVSAFQETIENYYGQKAHAALGGKKEVETAALISGGAYRAAAEAAKEGVDCFITGNFDEPVWHTAFEEGINFFAMGHFASERTGPLALREYIEKHFKIETIFLDEANPF